MANRLSMKKYTIVSSTEFIPKNSLSSRYSKKIVNPNFYGHINIHKGNEYSEQSMIDTYEKAFAVLPYKKEFILNAIKLRTQKILIDFCK